MNHPKQRRERSRPVSLCFALTVLLASAGCSQTESGQLSSAASDVDHAGGDGQVEHDQSALADAETILSDPGDGGDADATDGVAEDATDAQTADAEPDSSSTSCAGQCGTPLTSDGCGCDIDCATKQNCCSDYATQCKATIGVCGDNKCHPKEAALGCTQDCKAKGDYSCLAEKCPVEYQACAGEYVCEHILDCVSHCTTDTCRGECGIGVNGSPDGKKKAAALSTCALAQCHLAIPSNVGICGDGVCHDIELQTCPADCAGCSADSCETTVSPAWSSGCKACFGTTDTPAAECALANCKGAWLPSCNWLCHKEFACMEKYGSLDVCASGTYGSVNSNLMACALAANCFQPTDTWSCEGKCGQSFADQPCGCAQDCLLSGTCCSDFGQFCPALASEHCGNGSCEVSVGETAGSCAADCGPAPCASTGTCATGLVCCGVGEASVCRLPAECTGT